jgi:hypothetical protein
MRNPCFVVNGFYKCEMKVYISEDIFIKILKTKDIPR